MNEADRSITDNVKTVSGSSIAFLSGTLFSRLTGLGRDMAMAFCFGSQPAIAAFMVAFRFANLIRRLFGEGPLAAGFIPHFEHVRGEDPQKGAQFFRDLFFSLVLCLAFIIGAAEIILAAIWHWGVLSPANEQIIFLTMLMLPGVLFICLYGISSGLLQCEKRFFLTGFAPVAFNVVWIAAVIWLKDQVPSSAVIYLSLAVVVAFFMQWMMVAPHTFSFLKQTLSWKNILRFQFFSSEMRAVLKPFLLGVLGVGAVQINAALDAIFARYASLEGPAYLWYAIRLQQLPLALFGIALSAALLPPLARAIKANLLDKYLELFRFSFRRSFSLIFPCMMGIFVLGAAAINLIYGRGDFSNESSYQTVICLWGYGLGLVPAVFVLLLAPAFYAKKNFRTPMIGSVFSVVLNAIFSGFFVFGLGWGAFSVAVATSLAAWANYFYLSYHLSKQAGTVWDKEVVVSFTKTVVCSLIAGVLTLLVGFFLVGDPTCSILQGAQEVSFARTFSTQVLQFLALAGTFFLVLFSYAWMVNANDLLEVVGLRQKADANIS